MKWKDFVIDDPRGTFGTLDIFRLLALPDDDFSKLYGDEMKLYVQNHGHDPICYGCNDAVDADQLVRYFGANLHSRCFSEAYQGERETLDHDAQQYFDHLERLRHTA